MGICNEVREVGMEAESLVDVVYEMWQHPETAEYAARVLNAAYRLVDDVKKSVNETWEAGLNYAAEKVRQTKGVDN